MARLKPQKDLIDLINKFSQKNSIYEFKELYKNLYQEMNNYSLIEKLKGGEYQTTISELSTLNCILDKYSPSHVEYTGNKSNSSVDGVLYFGNEKQNIEITGMIDENEMKSVKNCGRYELITTSPIIRFMKEFCCTEDQARKYLKSQLMDGQYLSEDLLYEKIVYLFKKKNKRKYNAFWLLISYAPSFHMGAFGEKDVRDFILQKIKLQEQELVSSIRMIFKKIIFVPFTRGAENHKIFEWLTNS